jgi:cysteine-rich repeat protein
MRRLALLLLLIACGEDKVVVQTDLTGIRLKMTFAQALGLTQLQIDSIGGAPMRSATLELPASGSTTGTREESVVILFADELAGSAIDLRVRGSAGGMLAAEGRGKTTLQRAVLVDLTIALEKIDVEGCGDGAIEDEQCDDGNIKDGDGCSATCATEPGFMCNGAPSICVPVCGDGAIAGKEVCDDGGTTAGDGCDASCAPETGWVCTGEPSVCNQTCSNGTIDTGEECDDANAFDADGCSASCRIEGGYSCSGTPSVCTPLASCGDGAIDQGEECDDDNAVDGDGCTRGCQIEGGWTCTGMPSVCEQTCGNGSMDAGEQCDDGDRVDGDGCSADCQIEPGFDCGDGLIRGTEVCDDNNPNPGDGCSARCTVEPGYICTDEPSECTQCGNGAVDPGEFCDGGFVNDQTCLSQGHLGGTLGCNSTCSDYDFANCGSLIDTPEELQRAINQAYNITGGPEVVAIPAGTFAPNNELVFDESGSPSGLILRPLNGPVVIVGARLRIRSGSNFIFGIEIRDAGSAIFFEDTGAGSGNNTVRNMLFSYSSVTPENVVLIASNGNRVVANRIENGSIGAGQTGILFDGAIRSTVAMNVIYGTFAYGMRLISVNSATVDTFIDHNSIWMPSPSTGTGVRFDDASDICFRNNIVWGSGNTTGFELEFVDFSNTCPGGNFNNVNGNNGTECVGLTCAFYCTGGGQLCDLFVDPGYDQAPSSDAPALCLSSGNSLVDAGLDLGYDMVDGAPESFYGSAPDLGAREAGSTRDFGGMLSTCPN